MALPAAFFTKLGAIGRGMGVWRQGSSVTYNRTGGLTRGGQLAVAGAAINTHQAIKNENQNRRRGT